MKADKLIRKCFDLIADMAGDEEKKKLERKIDQFLSQKCVTTFFGPYDSGKSTLLKRLLIEKTLPVPAWLTISAKRETFEVNEVCVDDITIKDTPGIGTGNVAHDHISEEAIGLTDILVVVIPPQLLTASQERILSVIDGSFFEGSEKVTNFCLPVIYVISRLDEVGIDPSENLDEFNDLAQRKVLELQEILKKGSIDTSAAPILCLIADPYQQMVNNKAKAKDFDDFRSWDGITSFIDTLEKLKDKNCDIKQASILRFLLLTGKNLMYSINTELKETRLAKDDCFNQLCRLKTHELSLDNLLKEAKKGLLSSISDLISITSKNTGAGEKEVLERFTHDLKRAYSEWQHKYNREIEVLANDMNTEWQERMVRPSARLFDSFFRCTRQSESFKSTDHEDIFMALRKLGPKMRLVKEKLCEIKFGSNFTKLQREYEKIQDFSSLQDFFESKKSSIFKTADNINLFKKIEGVSHAVSSIGPICIELADLYFSLKGKHEQIKERAARREKLQNKIEQQTESLTNNLWKNWFPSAKPLLEHLQQARQNIETNLKNLEEIENSYERQVQDWNSLKAAILAEFNTIKLSD